MLAYVVTQDWKLQLGVRLYRPLVIGQKGPGTIALVAEAKVDWQQNASGHSAGASSTAQASTGNQWWQDNWNQALAADQHHTQETAV